MDCVHFIAIGNNCQFVYIAEMDFELSNRSKEGNCVSKEFLGCCGAYCQTCKVYLQQLCKGCKVGYDTGERDIAKAKCAMKVCCVKRGLVSCADCVEYTACETLAAFYGHESYKYKKYKQATEYIRANGYEAFFRVADGWRGAYGGYDEPER